MKASKKINISTHDFCRKSSVMSFFSWLTVLVLLVCGAKVHAENIAGAVVLSDDLKAQRLLFQSSRKNVQYNIALGAFKKVNSEWVVDDEQEVHANVDSVTFEFVSRISMAEAWDILKSNFLHTTSKVLFTCNGLDCGSSNVWANDYFKIKQLYGLNPSQRYLAVSDNIDGAPVFKVLYMVKRGNRRIMAHVDTIWPTPDPTKPNNAAVLSSLASQISNSPANNISPNQEVTTELILESLFQNKYWIFPVNVFNGTLDENRNGRAMDRYVQMIKEALNRRTSLSLYVVGHNNQAASESIQLRESKTGAELLYETLIEAGVDKTRLSVLGLGSYVPRNGALGTRVELVVRSSP